MARTTVATRRSKFELLELRRVLAADPGFAFGLGGPIFLTDVADAEVKVGPDDHVYVAGSFRNTVDFDPGPATVSLTTNQNAQDGFIAKYTLQGSLVWVQRFGQAVAPVGVGNEFATGLEFDAAGHLYVAGWTNAAAPKFGSTTLTGLGSWDAFVSKLDATSGAFQWTRGLGGVGDDRANGLTVSPTGDVYVTGSFRDAVDFDPSPSSSFMMSADGASDAYVWKLDAAGNFAWARQFRSPLDEFGHRVVLDGVGGVYAAGAFRDTTDFGEPGAPLTLTAPKSDDADVYLVKLDDVTGNTAWARQATGPEHINAARLAVDNAGNLYLAAAFQGEVSFGAGTSMLLSEGAESLFVSKWNAAGNLAWAHGLNVVLRAAARSISISAACRDLARAPSDQAMITALDDGLPRRFRSWSGGWARR